MSEVNDAIATWVRWDLKPVSSILQPKAKPLLDPVSLLEGRSLRFTLQISHTISREHIGIVEIYKTQGQEQLPW